MADKERPQKELWMFRGRNPAPEPGEVDFDPVDAIYHLRKNTRNPYLKRAVAPGARKAGQSAADLRRLFRNMEGETAYQVAPANRHEPFTRRSLAQPAPPAVTAPRYQESSKMAGDIYKLPWLINEFFQSVLERLRRDPGEFDQVVGEMLELFEENKIKIVLYEAYYSFRDWDHMMETLGEISHYPSPETFDLFCSALFAYHELVYPPGGE